MYIVSLQMLSFPNGFIFRELLQQARIQPQHFDFFYQQPVK